MANIDITFSTAQVLHPGGAHGRASLLSSPPAGEQSFSELLRTGLPAMDGPLDNLFESGQEELPLPLLVEVAAVVERPLLDQAARLTENAWEVVSQDPALPTEMLEEELVALELPVIFADLPPPRVAAEPARPAPDRVSNTGKGLPSPVLFALSAAGSEQMTGSLNSMETVSTPPGSTGAASLPPLSAQPSPIEPVTGTGFAPPRTESSLPSTAPVAPEVTLSLNQKNWNQSLGQQLVWMVQNQVQKAEIKVHPAHLGPLEVRLSLHQDQASVSFYSHDAAVRDLLESTLPRLREMLGSQGVQLGQAQVADQSLARHQQESGERPSGQGGAEAQGAVEGGVEEEQPPSLPDRLGLVDHYI